MQATLKRLSDQADPSNQVDVLHNWQQQWQQCGYPPDSTYINGWLQVGLAHLYRNELVAATQAVQQAVRLSKTRRPIIAIDQPAKALYRLGMLLTEQNQPAIDVLQQAVQQGRGIRSADRWVSGAYLYLAYAYYSAGDFQQTLNSAESGEQVARNTGDKPLMIKILHEKVKALTVLEYYEPARQVAERAVLLAEQENNKAMIARGYQLLGDISKHQKQLTDALKYCQLAFRIAPPTDPTVPNYAVEVGMLYYQLGRYDQAISYFQYGVDKNTNSYAKAYSLDRLGQVHHQKKAFSLALQYYQQGLVTMPIGFRNPASTSLPDARSIRQADQKDYLLALIQDKADTWLDYAKATNNNRQRLQHALDTYTVVDQMIDFMRWEHTGQQSKLFWRQKTRAIYERAIETCYLLGNAEQAFRFLEKSRAVMLADKLNELSARQKLSRQQLEQEERLQQAVSSQQSQLADIKPDDSTAYNSTRMALFAKQDSLATFLKNLEVSNPAYYTYKYDNTTTSLPDLHRYLKKQQSSLITYFVGDSTLYVMGVTGDTVMLRKQSVRTYTQTLRQFDSLLANSEAMSKTTNVGRFRRLSNSLYRQLLAPLALPKGRVVVSPDGVFIPFDALSKLSNQFDYAVNDYAFSYVYSASLLLKNRLGQVPKPGYQTGRFLGVAPVEFAPVLKQVTLPNSDKALLSIAGRFASPTLLLHGAATRKAFLAEAATARTIHLFTHAAADNTDREPTLYFADSTLQLSDLSDNAFPNAQLVVLAACKTGIGANQRGEGVFSLARGFAALGVPSVLTTLWSVQNEATYQLTNLFYTYLDQGLPKDIALQRAKQDWLKTAEGVNQLPNYWAGLIVVGSADPLPRLNFVLWGSILFVLTIIASLIFWHERRSRQIRLPEVSLLQPA
ncbi:CHAT domain-containing protein [Spirosoma flavum]|uniref:CHAT domain-containing protein n=1 Tax=Spirosoma flavum TaxID=2048557 RepID=A0ABW6AD80_9BACT